MDSKFLRADELGIRLEIAVELHVSNALLVIGAIMLLFHTIVAFL